MNPSEEKLLNGFTRVKILRELTKKKEDYRGENIMEVVRRHLRLKAPGLNDKILELREYDPLWPVLFKAEKKRIADHLDKKVIVDIRHIGSTAIPGQSSNNIIDMALILETADSRSQNEAILLELGYRHFGNSPMGPGATWFWKTGEPGIAFVLHVDGKENVWLEGNIDFCNYLAAHPGERRIYNNFKKNIAELKKKDIMLYSLKKLELFIEIEGKAGQWAKENSKTRNRP